MIIVTNNVRLGNEGSAGSTCASIDRYESTITYGEHMQHIHENDEYYYSMLREQDRKNMWWSIAFLLLGILIGVGIAHS